MPQVGSMASPKSTPLASNSLIKPKAPFKMVVSGNWRLTDRRLERAASHRLSQIIFLTVALILTLLLLLCVHVFIVHRSSTHCSLSNEIANRVDLLETRLTFLEDNFGSMLTNHVLLRRRTRSAQAAYSEAESVFTLRNSSDDGVKIDIQAIQFTSTVSGPFTNRPFRGVIGPWSEHRSHAHKMDSFGLKLVEGNRKVEISRAGIYYIYSQVTYPSTNTVNSYSINLISPGDRKPTPISACHAPVELTVFEGISCHTSIARALKPRDMIYLELVEPNASIIKDGKNTFFGIILLNAPY